MSAKVTLPTQSLLQGGPYVNSNSTDVRARFERMRREALPPKAQNVAPIRKQQK